LASKIEFSISTNSGKILADLILAKMQAGS